MRRKNSKAAILHSGGLKEAISFWIAGSPCTTRFWGWPAAAWPPVAIRAVALGGNVYGGMSLEAASLFGKRFRRPSEFKPLGSDVPPPFVGGGPFGIASDLFTLSGK
jgi:hypothetical protein